MVRDPFCPRFCQARGLVWLLEENTVTDGLIETKHFIYFYLGHCAILLFKTQ